MFTDITWKFKYIKSEKHKMLTVKILQYRFKPMKCDWNFI